MPGEPPRSHAASRPLRGSPGVFLVFAFLGSLLVGFILLPLVRLAATQTGATLWHTAQTADIRAAIWLSLVSAFVTALVAGVFGVPLAYLLARGSFPGKPIIAAIVDIPLTVPHSVVGIALLIVFGRRGIIGAPAEALIGLKFWGTMAGIVVAMLFVSAPYTVNAARIAFESVDPRLEMVARTLGMGPWRTLIRVTMPLSWRSILTGLTLTYARSISEFGAVAILVYYPMTAPVQIYELFLRYGLNAAAGAAVLLLIVTIVLFILLRSFAFGRGIGLSSRR